VTPHRWSTRDLTRFTGRVPWPSSRPATAVAIAALVACASALLVPFTVAGSELGLRPLPVMVLGALGLTVFTYLARCRLTKAVYRRLTGRWL
jgi:P-type Mg2+ transporter